LFHFHKYLLYFFLTVPITPLPNASAVARAVLLRVPTSRMLAGL
jgi:hypothetical protein